MNTWQEWVVGLILVICAIQIVRIIYAFVKGAKKGDNPCANCASGCDLKHLYEEKKNICEQKTQKGEKSFNK